MSANATNAIPTAAGTRVLRSATNVGHAEVRQAAGDGADDGDLAGEVEHGDRRGRADDGQEHAGILGETRRRPMIVAIEPMPIASAAGSVWSSPATKSRTAGMKFSARPRTRTASGAGATITVTAMPAR